jgi:hypothetical protein
MFLSYFTLFVALSLSVIAAWYSIVGLTAIFAAAVVPIIIMGSALEVAKITATIWLHEHWNRARWLMRLYLTSAVIILMIITSMGIFGFLSRAHIEQSAPIGDTAAQIEIIDEKIAIEQEVIEQYRRDLAILNQQIERFSELGAVSRGVNARAAQQAEREKIFAQIESSQQTITELRQQRAPLTADIRKIETEVGPIKYIAALIYGDNPDQNLLEKAVRWMIILLVAVFDPLAIMLVLAATESLKWNRERNSAPEEIPPAYEPDDGALTDEQLAEIETAVAELDQSQRSESILEQHPYLNKGFAHFENLKPMAAPANGSQSQFVDDEQQFDELPLEDIIELDEDDDDNELLRQAKHLWKLDNPGKTLKEQRHLHEIGAISELPWLSYLDDPRIAPDAGFGRDFPTTAKKGDMFLLTSKIPTQLYKYNGTKWITVDKTLIDHYAYNESYIDYLIEAVGAGKYDTDLLTDIERSQIEIRLNSN